MGKRRKKQMLPAAEGAAASGSGIAAPAPHSKIDYSKFDNIEDSDEDDHDRYTNDMACRPGCPFHNHDCASGHPLAEEDGGVNSEADECEEDLFPPRSPLEWLNQAKRQADREEHAHQQGVKGLGSSTLSAASKKPALRQGFFNFGGSKTVRETVSQAKAASSAFTHSSSAYEELSTKLQSKDGKELLRRLGSMGDGNDGPPPLQDGSERDSEESDAESTDSGEESEGPPDLIPGSDDSDAEEPPAKKGKAKAGAKPSGSAPAVSEPATAKAAKAVEASSSVGGSSSFNFTFAKGNANPAPASAKQTTGSRPTEQTNGSKQSRAAAPPKDDEFPGFVSDEEEIEQFKISVACGVMDEALAKRLRSGEFKDTKRGAADLPPAFAGKPQMPAASSSTGASAASKPAAAKAQPVLAKASAKRSGTAAAATQPPASKQKAGKPPAASTDPAVQQPAPNATAAGPSHIERRKAGKSLQVEETSNDDDDDDCLATADSRKPQTVQPRQQTQNKDEALPAQAVGETAEEIRQRRLKEAEEHFKSLLAEEEAAGRERQQQAKLQEERDAARREKRKAKAKKKKEKAGKGAPSQEPSPPQPGEAVSADAEQEDEAPPALAASVASSWAAAPASGSAAKSAGPTPRSLREEDEAAFNADSDSDNNAGPGATSSNPFDVLDPARAAARPAHKATAAQKAKPSGSSAGKQPGIRLPRAIPASAAGGAQPAMQRAAEPPASRRPPSPAPYLPTELPRPTGYAPPALNDEANKVWSTMEVALHAGTAPALAGAISTASAWLTAHGTSKVWMAANSALRERLQRARQMLTTAQQRGEPGAGPGLQRPSPLPRPTHNPHHPGTGRGTQPLPAYAPPIGAAAQYPHDPADPFGGVAMGGRQRGSGPAWQPAASVRPAFKPQAAAAPPPPLAKLQVQPLATPASLPMAFDTVVAIAQQGGHEEDKNDCIVCMDAPMDVILVPCGHSNLCSWCADAVKRCHEGLCPTCREPIKEIVQAKAA